MNKLLLSTLFFFFILFNGIAQPGKDGVYTATNNVIINKYAPVLTDITAGTSTIAIVNQTAMLHLCPGDLILIYQAQGAAINLTNTISYGDISTYNSAGLYEFAYVKEANGNVVTTTSTLANNYSSAGMAQVLRVPQYSTLTIAAGGNISASAWRDTTISNVLYRFGGIVAMHATYISNNGLISADAKGFRGGASDASTVNTNYSSNVSGYTSTVSTQGGEKGESIVGYNIDYDLLGGRYGRGAPANGGGGGNGWNSGGGGGANANSGAVYTGQGVMDGTATGAVAWGLDPAYIANGNMLTTSSGGGRGGYSVGLNANNPLTIMPGNAQWGGDNRREVGGLGGKPVFAQARKRIFFGGGGGAGDENNFCSNNGGNGGGLVFVVATSELAGTGTISSIGGTGGNTKNAGFDAASGGGGGGSIVVLSPSVSANMLLTVKGGHGGNQVQSVNEVEGPGGGGGGGYIESNANSLFMQIGGGDNGITFSNLMTAFPSNGATQGAKGQFTQTTYSFVNYNVNSIVTASINSPICKGETFTLTSTGPSNAAFNWSGPAGFSAGSQTVTIVNTTSASAGVYTLSMAPEGCADIKVTVNAAFGSCVGLEKYKDELSEILVYPTPAKNQVTIVYSGAYTASASIIDGTGKQCIVKELDSNETIIDISTLAAGIYNLRITLPEGNSALRRIIVE